MKLFELLNEKEKKLGRLLKFKKEQILFDEEEECSYVGLSGSGLSESVLAVWPY